MRGTRGEGAGDLVPPKGSAAGARANSQRQAGDAKGGLKGDIKGRFGSRAPTLPHTVSR